MHTISGVVVVEREQRGQMPVDRGRASSPTALAEDDDVLRRGPEPGHESGDVIHLGFVPPRLDVSQKLQPELEAGRVGPERGRRAVECLKVSQVCLDRRDRIEVSAEHSPGLGPVRHRHTLHSHRAFPCLDETAGRLQRAYDNSASTAAEWVSNAAHGGHFDQAQDTLENMSSVGVSSLLSDIEDTPPSAREIAPYRKRRAC